QIHKMNELPATADYCEICRINHCCGKKHKYSNKHKKKVDILLEKFQQHIASIREFLVKPVVEDGDYQTNLTFWCHICRSSVTKNITNDQVTVINGGSLEHLASSEHYKNMHKFWIRHGIDNNKKKEFYILKDDFSKYKVTLDQVLGQMFDKREEDTLKLAQEIKQQEQNRTSISKLHQDVQHHAVTYTTVTSSLGILQNPTGWHDGTRVWGGGIVKYSRQSDQWFPWPIDLDEESCKVPVPIDDENEGNILSGATPPWLLPDEKDQKQEIGPSQEAFQQQVANEEAKRKNPKRIGANYDRTTTINENWLPLFGQVWNSGPRSHSRHDFKHRRR
ncbi:Coiled-coil domain-containing protein 84, partial [Trichoplax sp. H2]